MKGAVCGRPVSGSVSVEKLDSIAVYSSAVRVWNALRYFFFSFIFLFTPPPVREKRFS